MAALQYDVVIVGARFGGVSAALAAAADPKVRVALLEPGEWVGGQATSQGVTRWDEASAEITETAGSSRSYRDLRNSIRAQFRAHATISALGAQHQWFNAGFAASGPPFVQPGHPFAADPRVVQTVLHDMLAALQTRIDLRPKTTVARVEMSGDAIASVTAVGPTGAEDTFNARTYLDATDLGDLLPLFATPWRIGAKSKAQTGEPDAEDAPHSEWIQPITAPIAVELRPPDENHRIPKPANYDRLSQAQKFRVNDGDITTVIKEDPAGHDSLWNYRRYVDARNFDDDRYRCDRSTINVGSNDYQSRTLPTGSSSQDAEVIEEARAVSIAYVYWLQNECERDDDETAKGYPNLMIRTDAFESADGTAPTAYIRESRRLADPR